jgi:two-component system, NarL family, response regulator NreC
VLTERELSVLRLLAAGHTNREIAGRLFLSVRTVEFHRANIRRKLGASSRAELTRHVRENAL